MNTRILKAFSVLYINSCGYVYIVTGYNFRRYKFLSVNEHEPVIYLSSINDINSKKYFQLFLTCRQVNYQKCFPFELFSVKVFLLFWKLCDENIFWEFYKLIIFTVLGLRS